MRLTRAECASKYGQIENGVWLNEAKFCVSLSIPIEIKLLVKNSADRRSLWRSVYCNRDMAGPLNRALLSLIRTGAYKELKSFDGCFNVRNIRGSKTLISAHAYALAIDFNASLMPLGSNSKWSEQFVKCFTDEGFTNGSIFERKDPQHFSIVGF